MHGDASYIRHNSGTQQQQAPSLNSAWNVWNTLPVSEVCTAPHTGPRLVLYTGVEQLVAAADTLKTDLHIYISTQLRLSYPSLNTTKTVDILKCNVILASINCQAKQKKNKYYTETCLHMYKLKDKKLSLSDKR